MTTETISAKSMLVPSKLPDADYVVNPYTGCRLGCAYCYASFMGRMVGEPIQAWGDYLYVKENAVELFRRDIERLPAAKQHSTLLISSVTDPYQPVESRQRITRGILEILSEKEYPGRVGILTKSPLVTRDIDLFLSLQEVEVGLTVTTTEDAISRWLEVRAPNASKRIEALETLNAAGVPTYAFVGPLLPHFRNSPDLLDDLFARLSQAGVTSVYVEHMNLKGYIRKRLDEVVAEQPPEVQASYERARQPEHRAALSELVNELLTKYGMTLRLAQVLHHGKRPTSDGR